MMRLSKQRHGACARCGQAFQGQGMDHVYCRKCERPFHLSCVGEQVNPAWPWHCPECLMQGMMEGKEEITMNTNLM